MGYSHSWTRPKVIEKETYEKMRHDFIRLIQNLPESFPVHNTYFGFPLVIKGWDGISDIDLSNPNEFKFNGDGRHQIKLNLIMKEETDQMSHDTFSFNRKLNRQIDEKDRGIYSDFCKTYAKPYDLAVCGCLLIAKFYLQKDFTFQSAGNIYTEQSWPEARKLVTQINPKIAC